MIPVACRSCLCVRFVHCCKRSSLLVNMFVLKLVQILINWSLEKTKHSRLITFSHLK